MAHGGTTWCADSFAARLGRLIEQLRERRGPLSYRRIAQDISALGGPTISAAYLQQLVTGKRGDPKISYVQAFARYFDVPVTYFFDEQTSAQADSPGRIIALRAESLSTEGRRQIMGLLDYVWRAERGRRH
ncbi:helix-turn-helix domain-containing protein [Sciscionella sediminilitoris]|uniref:helix-turn-helix domain-containing protein n=1 Tax=Sciscionella sediminilitoris TaxID=1445613 RepID=UPI0004DFC758|nr:helix-turn-helix domain-containing protein [Sciscionella sp. SE31]